MTKLKELLSKTNVPMAGFIIFTLYSVIAGFSIGSAIASFSFGGLYAFSIYLEHEDRTKELETKEKNIIERLVTLESNISVLKVSNGLKTNEQRKVY